jgi:hypothetical protein
MYVVLKYTYKTIKIRHSSIDEHFNMEARPRTQEDQILVAAVHDSLSLLGEPMKTYFLLKLGLIDENGNDLSGEGVLDYDIIVEQIRQIFAESGSTLILQHLDKQIAEHRSTYKTSD